MKVRWSRRALADLARIADHIVRDEPLAAAEFVRAVAGKVERLALFPLLGRTGVYQNTRELVVHKNYLVTYQRIHPKGEGTWKATRGACDAGRLTGQRKSSDPLLRIHLCRGAQPKGRTEEGHLAWNVRADRHSSFGPLKGIQRGTIRIRSANGSG